MATTSQQFFCYLLQSLDCRRTYIGATTDVDRRLAQHNRGVRSGGARATAGRAWRRVLYVSGPPTWPAALQLEWAWKHASRSARHTTGRIQAVLEVLGGGRTAPTRQGVPYAAWEKCFLHVSPDFADSVEKIETRHGKLVCVGHAQNHTTFFLTSFPSFFPFLHPTEMSSSAAAAPTASIAALIAQIDTMQLAYNDLKKRLDDMQAQMAAAAPAAVAAAPAAAPKRRGRPPKAAVAAGGAGHESDASSTGSGKKRGRKPRDPKDKPVCPPAAAGVIRFCSSVGDAAVTFLSPLFRSAFVVDGKEYIAVENYMQAARYFGTDDAYAETIRAQKNPVLTRGMGRSKDHAHRADWTEATQVAEYLKALRAKFAKPELRDKLLATGSAILEYESPQDSVWGIGADGTGQNLYGKWLMHVRGELEAEDEGSEDEGSESDESTEL